MQRLAAEAARGQSEQSAERLRTAQAEERRLRQHWRECQGQLGQTRDLLTAMERQARGGQRSSQVRTVDRSERVRTYNFPENRISDHRVGYKAYNLDQVLDGELDAVIDALEAADTAERVEAAT